MTNTLKEYCEKHRRQVAATPVIVCAANLLEDGTIVPGVRHYDPIMNKLIDKLGSEVVAQGFIDNFGMFWPRDQALEIAIENGQSLDMKRNGSTKELFSEGLY